MRPDIAHYREWSERVWALVREMSTAVEVLGMDEGYLELPDEDAGEAADAIRRAVGERIRLSCSLGVATCKVVAKVASDRDKPGGVTVVAPGEEAAFLAPLPLRTLPGRGAADRGAPDRRRGSRPSATWRRSTTSGCASWRPGSTGGAAGAGARHRPAAGGAAPGGADLHLLRDDVRGGRARPGELERVGRGQAAEVAEPCAAAAAPARTVTVKLRYADFQTITRAQTVHGADRRRGRHLDHRPRRCSLRALGEREGALRLMGVGVSGLSAERQLTLFGPSG